MNEAKMLRKLEMDYGVKISTCSGEKTVIRVESLPSILIAIKNYLENKNDTND